MKARDALSQALIMVVEDNPVIRVYSASQQADGSDWRIELKYPDGSYATVREIDRNED